MHNHESLSYEFLIGLKPLTMLDSGERQGYGLFEAVKAKILEPFFMAKPTGQGTGLGLSLAYGIVTKGHKERWTWKAGKGREPCLSSNCPGALPFTLTANLRLLLKDRGEAPINHPVVFAYAADRQQPVTLRLAVEVRSNFRHSSVNCSFPPLL